MKFLAFCLLLLTMQARGATNAELEAQVESLTQRVQKLERLLSEVMEARGAEAREVVATTSHQAASAKPVATKPAAAGSSLKMGGRVKLDVIANSVSVGGTGGQNRGDVALFPNAIPLTASGEDHQLSGNARDSRLWVNATNSTDYGDLGAYIELDFGSYDNSGNERVSNSHNPRIRHAYATYGGFTVGQTTSTFQNMIAFPEINEANGPA
ncbi:MAG: porin, partial [Pseudomonadales bacterium]|nr:porin [Pseudomonadales bacterium]